MKRYRLVACMLLAAWIMCVPSWGTCSADPAASQSAPEQQDAFFRVLDISERTYDDGPAIAVLLSEPLDPKIRHDAHLRISDDRRVLKSAWVLSEDNRVLYYPHVAPETEYTVTVLESLRSAAGQQVRERVSKAVTTRKINPVVSFASEGLLLPAKMAEGLPVAAVNVPAVDVEFFKLKQEALVQFVNWRNITGKKGYYQLANAKKYGDLVFSGRFDLDAPPNKRVVRHLPIDDIAALQAPGVYLAVMREPGEYAYNYQSTYYLVTDVGLHARVYDAESHIFASSLKTGQALQGVKLSFLDHRGASVATGETDADGRYKYAGKLPGSVHLILASHENQTGILPLRLPALDMSEFDIGKRPQKKREIFTYSPRDLYRPGENVVVSALLRDYDGRPVRALPLKARLFRPDGRELKKFTWRAENLDAEGVNYYQTAFDLPGDAQTGAWRLKLYDDPGSKAPAGLFEFHVEEFLPERMKLDLDAQTESPGPDETLVIDVTGQYLYGAPAAGNKISAYVWVKAKRELSEAYKGFRFGDVRDAKYRDSWQIGEQSLDKLGRTTLEIESRWAQVNSPLMVGAAVSLYETGGRPVTRSVRHDIWPAEALIGVRPLFKKDYADEGPVSFEVIRLHKDGTLTPAKGVLAELVKEDRDYYWEYSDSQGWRYRYTEKNYQYLTDSLTLSGKGPTVYTLQMKQGRYLLSLKDPETGVSTSVRFHVGYWGYDDRSAAHPEKVLLKLDKPAYRPGDVIQLTVTPPHDGDALISIEGDAPVWFTRRAVSARGTVLEIPVSAKWDSHNLYVSAVVFRPGDAVEKITPNRSAGLVHLPLERSDRKLDVAIDAPDKAAPQTRLDVTLTLKDAGGTPSDRAPVFVTLAAVDVGILNITDFKTPDPFGWFFEQRRFDVNSYDIYGKVIELQDGTLARLRYGGDADETPGGKKPETKVKLVSLFNGPVTFDAGGRAVVSFDIPDFNGRLRLMAVAFDKTRFGSAEDDVTVAAPIVTQLAAPRFLAPGDQAEFTLDVHNLSDRDQNISLTLESSGRMVITEGEKTFALKDKEKETLRFPVTAAYDFDFGGENIRLHLEGDGVSLDREWQIGVRPGYPGIARSVRQILKTGETFTLDPALAADLIPSTMSASVKISSHIPINLKHAMEGLIRYPYGCLEQTTSSAYPLLYATPERTAAFNLPYISHEERIKRLDVAVERLAGMQLPSGGFGLWNKSSPETGWLTAYVTDFLLQARDLGVGISEEMLDKALKRLESYVKKKTTPFDLDGTYSREPLEFAVRCYAAYVLAKVNRAPLGALRTLYDMHHQKAESGLPLAHLGIALKRMGDEKRSTEALTAAALKRREGYAYWGDYGSPVRDLALTIGLFIAHKTDDIAGFDDLMLDLMETLRNRKWLSTQEKYALFRAGLLIEETSGRPWTGTLSVAGQAQSVTGEKGTYAFYPDMEAVTGGVRFTSAAEGYLYVNAAVSGYTKTPPARDDSLIAADRTLYDLAGKPVDRTEFKQGEILLAHLRVRSKEWLPDALAADLLPAGFEIENQNLKHGVRLEDIEIDGKSVWRLKESADILHEEYRDDRYIAAVRLDEDRVAHLFYLIRVVSPGVFSVPPPLVESMYRPEIRGIGNASEKITVLNAGF